MSAVASGQWTLGVLVGLPFACLGALILAGVIAAFLVAAHRADPQERSFTFDPLRVSTVYRLSAVGFVVVLLGYAVGIVAGYWPLSAEYHQYRSVTGTVATISNRFVGSGQSTSQKFVITLTTGSQQYGITDTRAALLHPGDEVSLRCIRVYEYGSNDAGYDCKWGQ